jgi:hypothetical protein
MSRYRKSVPNTLAPRQIPSTQAPVPNRFLRDGAVHGVRFLRKGEAHIARREAMSLERTCPRIRSTAPAAAPAWPAWQGERERLGFTLDFGDHRFK